MTITDQLRTALTDSGLTQSQIADAAGVSQRAVSQFLHGYQVRSDTLDALADAVGMTAKIPKRYRTNQKGNR